MAAPVTQEQLLEVRRRADAAHKRADAAFDHALEANQTSGKVLAAAGRLEKAMREGFEGLHGKADAAISDVRDLRTELRNRMDSMRPKVDTIPELEEEIQTLEVALERLKEARAIERKIVREMQSTQSENRKLRRRILIAAVLGFAGIIGAGAAGALLQQCHLPVPADMKGP